MALTFAQEDAEEELLSKALYVENSNETSVPYDPSKPPATAEEYLKSVMHEAKHLEGVAIAKNANKLTSNKVQVAVREKANIKHSKSILPTKEWQNKQVKDFSETRTMFARHVATVQKPGVPNKKRHKLPSKTNEQGWCCYCFGKDFWSTIVKAQKDGDESESASEDESTNDHNKPSTVFNDITEGQKPETSIITQLKQTEVVALLDFQISWVELVGMIREDQGLWLYSLMAHLDKPPHADVTSSMRSLVLACSRQRKQIYESENLDAKVEEGDNSMPKMTIHLNLIICLVARYFEQKDLADEY